MSRERWLRTKALFQEALGLPAAERAEFLDRACAGDAARRADVEALLASHDESAGFLERPPSRIAAEVLALAAEDGDPAGPDPLGDELPRLEGRRLGPYKIVRRIGRGGLGAVYLAVREEEFTKQVAIKLIRRRAASRELLRRFAGERQILALIEHPNIARLLDGGTTEEGLPYLVMEYIEGEPIDRFCDRRQLSIRQRLELFTTVCGAVEVAHRSLVVHCDIKPDNVLVTADGTPKLLDFGISRILGAEPIEDLERPEGGESRILTPGYASPEQLAGGPVTTATDVYSLGVLLYELLCGRRPHETRGRSLAEVARAADAEPTPPSETLAGGAEDAAARAASRAATPERLRRRLAGDLDAIVLRALRAEPRRRYPAVEQLAADVERHLGGFPVRARPAGPGVRAAKFVGRHRLAVVVAAGALITLLAFLAALAAQSARLAAARDRAEQEATKARAVSGFLQETLASADPFEGIGAAASVVDALDAAVPRIDGAFADKPELEAEVRYTAGMTYLRLGRYDAAEPLLLASLELRRRLGDPDSLDLARSLRSVGRLHQLRGAYPEAERRTREALAISRRAAAPDAALTAETIGQLATVLHDRGDFAAAERLYREALESRRALFGEEHPEVARSLDDLANLVHETGDLETAERMYREALEMRRRLLGDEHPDVSTSLNNVAAVLQDRQALDEAEGLYRKSLDIARRRLGAEHPQVATSLNNLATLLHDQGKLAGAEALYRESLTMTRQLLGEEHPEVAVSLGNLAGLLHDKGELDEAESLYRQSLAMTRRFLGDAHPGVAVGLENLAGLLEDRGELAGAEAALSAALEIHRQAVGEEHLDFGLTLAALARVVCRLGEQDRATAGFARALAVLDGAQADAELVAEIQGDLDACRPRSARPRS